MVFISGFVAIVRHGSTGEFVDKQIFNVKSHILRHIKTKLNFHTSPPESSHGSCVRES